MACFALLPGMMSYIGVAMTVIVATIYLREGMQLLREASQRLKAAESGESDPAAEVQPVSEQANEKMEAAASDGPEAF
jgi:hypothetical protein